MPPTDADLRAVELAGGAAEAGEPGAAAEVPSVATRRQILDATEDLLRRRGIGGTTTRAIAQQAGCAEGTIYRHFADKSALLCELVDSRFPDFKSLVRSLPGRAGTGDVRTTLEEVAAAALTFFRLAIPLVVVPLSDADLLMQQRRHFEAADTGPIRVFEDLTTYFAKEQAAGRVAGQVGPRYMARLVLGTCFSQAFVEALVGERATLGPDAEFVTEVVSLLMAGLEPAS